MTGEIRICFRDKCGKEFKYRRKGGVQRYCSRACAQKDWWETHRKRHNRNSRKSMRKWYRNRTPEQIEATKKWMHEYYMANRAERIAAAKFYKNLRQDEGEGKKKLTKRKYVMVKRLKKAA